MANEDVLRRLMRTLNTKIVVRSASGLDEDGCPIAVASLLYARPQKEGQASALLRASYGVQLVRYSLRNRSLEGHTSLKFRYELHLQQDGEKSIESVLGEKLAIWLETMPNAIVSSTIEHVNEWVADGDFIHIHTDTFVRRVCPGDKVGGAHLLYLGMIAQHLDRFVLDCREMAIATESPYPKALWDCVANMHGRYAGFLNKRTLEAIRMEI